MYTLDEWTEFCTKKLDRLTVINLPVLEAALNKAIPGSKAHCTIANALVAYTGMDPKFHDISVDAVHIKFVIEGRRYFFYHEVAGAEHVKDLDTLAFCEEGAGQESARKTFAPFNLKLRYSEDKPVFTRPGIAARDPAEKKEKKAEVASQTFKEGSPETNLFGDAPVRRKRKDAGVAKSRWARPTTDNLVA